MVRQPEHTHVRQCSWTLTDGSMSDDCVLRAIQTVPTLFNIPMLMAWNFLPSRVFSIPCLHDSSQAMWDGQPRHTEQLQKPVVPLELLLSRGDLALLLLVSMRAARRLLHPDNDDNNNNRDPRNKRQVLAHHRASHATLCCGYRYKHSYLAGRQSSHALTHLRMDSSMCFLDASMPSSTLCMRRPCSLLMRS